MQMNPPVPIQCQLSFIEMTKGTQNKFAEHASTFTFNSLTWFCKLVRIFHIRTLFLWKFNNGWRRIGIERYICVNILQAYKPFWTLWNFLKITRWFWLDFQILASICYFWVTFLFYSYSVKRTNNMMYKNVYNFISPSLNQTQTDLSISGSCII